jgi:hypothetical protein
MTRYLTISLRIVTAVLVALLAISAAAQEMVTAEQVLTRHLASVAPATALKSIAYLEVSGTVQVRGTQTFILNGTAQLFSERERVKLVLKFPSNEYRGEQFVADGQKVQIAQIAPGVRSGIGEFMFREPVIASEGLIGGVLSAKWPIYDLANLNAKWEYLGLTTIDGRKAHQLSYLPKKKDSQLQIRLFFDAENFQHIRSIYRLKTADFTPAEASGRYVQPSEHQQVIYEIEEDFKDFKKLGDFNFPLTEQIRYSNEFLGPRIYEIKFDTINQQKVR